MADQAVQIALLRINEQLRTSLAKAIEHTKKLRQYGQIFADPVDAFAMQLADYYEVIKRPMDFSTLRTNLTHGEYVYMHEFLKDADLVFNNCRIYNMNVSEGFFVKASDEAEKFFLQQLAQIDQLRITPEQYKIIVHNPIPNIPCEEEGPVSMLMLQLLAKKLNNLPSEVQKQLIDWYYKQLGSQDFPSSVKNLTINFKILNSRVIREFDKLVTRKLYENKGFKRTK